MDALEVAADEYDRKVLNARAISPAHPSVQAMYTKERKAEHEQKEMETRVAQLESDIAEDEEEWQYAKKKSVSAHDKKSKQELEKRLKGLRADLKAAKTLLEERTEAAAAATAAVPAAFGPFRLSFED